MADHSPNAPSPPSGGGPLGSPASPGRRAKSSKSTPVRGLYGQQPDPPARPMPGSDTETADTWADRADVFLERIARRAAAAVAVLTLILLTQLPGCWQTVSCWLEAPDRGLEPAMVC